MLTAAVSVVLQDGLSGLTFAKVAEHLGVSDRMVVYYFPTKDVLTESVVSSLAESLIASLGTAFGDEELELDDLARRAWPVLATRRNDPVFRVFFELVGYASARIEPYSRLSKEILNEWAKWLESRVAGKTVEDRRAKALALMAQIDGLLLLRQTLGPKSADAAFRHAFFDERK
jgi:AcrR family transcriptional regulator